MRDCVDKVCHVQNHRKSYVQTDVEVNVDGVMGELAFARWKDAYPDFTLTPRSLSPDLVVEGISYDVKVTRHLLGKLVVSPKKIKSDVQRYVLGILLPQNRVRFVGWATRTELFQEYNHQDMFDDSYVLPQEKLHAF